MSAVFGRYYTWEEASAGDICPAGWRLPSDSDWIALGRKFGTDPTVNSPQTAPGAGPALMADASFNRDRMWARPSVSISATSGLAFIPTGYALLTDDGWNYTGMGSYATFWTSDQESGLGRTRYICADRDGLYSSLQEKTDFAASVRCVK